MLIEFSVSNFRSFREKQTFSMVAAPRLRKKENVFKPDVKGEKIPDLLKVAAIYGPNASGKSNLIKALGLIGDLARNKPTNISKPLPVAPFRFDTSLTNQPSRFDIHFISGGQRYEFELAATQERIIEERLVSFPKGKETLLYHRIYKPSGEEFAFGELEGGSVLHEAWRKLTSPKMLFITQAVSNSNEELQQLRVPYGWLIGNFNTIPRGMEDLANVAISIGNTHREIDMEGHIASFLQEIDIPVSSVKFEMKNIPEEKKGAVIPDSYLDNIQDEGVRSVMKSYKNVRATLTHKTALGEAPFDFDEESDGTKNLIGFSLPWRLIGNQSPAGYSLVIDELDSSLHPKIVASLIEKLLKLDNPSQLIFTTHDTHLMDTKLLRRDQLWLTERDMNGATQLRAIHDFEGRESEDIEKRYYEGRYRGLPILR